MARDVIQRGRRATATPFKDVFDLIVRGLELAAQAVPPQTDAAIGAQQVIMASSEDLLADPLPRLSKAELQEEFRAKVKQAFEKRRRDLISPMKIPLFKQRELACGVVLPFAPAMVASDSVIVRAAGAASLALCAIEIQETGPQAALDAFRRREIGR